MNLCLVVGTTPYGWDELVRAVDDVAEAQGISGWAQIGNGRYVPTTLSHDRFLPHASIVERMRSADVAVVHGGLGSIGDGLRHARRLVVAPRSLGVGRHGRQEAPNDQWPVALRLSEMYGFACVALTELGSAIAAQLEAPPQRWTVPPTDAPRIIEEWLESEDVHLRGRR